MKKFLPQVKHLMIILCVHLEEHIMLGKTNWKIVEVGADPKEIKIYFNTMQPHVVSLYINWSSGSTHSIMQHPVWGIQHQLKDLSMQF